MPHEVAHDHEAPRGLLGLLADDWTWLTFCELREEPERQEELEGRLPALDSSTVNRHLHLLMGARIAAESRLSQRPPLVAYQLTRAGMEARPIRPVAARWEARVSPACAAESQRPGSTAMGLLADEWVLPILRRVAVGSHHRSEIELRIPGLSESTLDDRLHRLRDLGLLDCARHRGFPARVEYELTPAGCWLPASALLSTRWEWRWTRPVRPVLASDLVGLVRLIAPLARAPATTNGVCELVVRSATAIEPSILLRVQHETITVLERSQRPAADARAEAPPLTWCGALISGTPKGLRISGQVTLVEDILTALHDVLSVDWHSPPA